MVCFKVFQHQVIVETKLQYLQVFNQIFPASYLILDRLFELINLQVTDHQVDVFQLINWFGDQLIAVKSPKNLGQSFFGQMSEVNFRYIWF